MLNVRGSGQGGAALLRQATYRTPPPTNTAWGAAQSEGGGTAHPKWGGGGSAKRPKRHRQAPVGRGQAFKRGRGHPDHPPPAKRARVEQHDAARHGRAERRSHNRTPPELLAQARPPTATPMGARQGGARNVRCIDFGGASGDHGGPGPMRVSLFSIVFPPKEAHTHTHTYTSLCLKLTQVDASK